jgi:hypothetical protein
MPDDDVGDGGIGIAQGLSATHRRMTESALPGREVRRREGGGPGGQERRPGKSVQWGEMEVEEKFYEVESSDYSSVPESPPDEPPGVAEIGPDGKIHWRQPGPRDEIQARYDSGAEYLSNWAHDGALYLPKPFRQGRAQIPGLQDSVSPSALHGLSPPGAAASAASAVSSGRLDRDAPSRPGSTRPPRDQPGYPSYLPQLQPAGPPQRAGSAAPPKTRDEIAISSAPQSTEVDPAAIVPSSAGVHRDPFRPSREPSPEKTERGEAREAGKGQEGARVEGQGSAHVKGAQGSTVTIPKLWTGGNVPRAEAMPPASGSVRVEGGGSHRPEGDVSEEGWSARARAPVEAAVAAAAAAGDSNRGSAPGGGYADAQAPHACDDSPPPPRVRSDPWRQDVEFTPDPANGSGAGGRGYSSEPRAAARGSPTRTPTSQGAPPKRGARSVGERSASSVGESGANGAGRDGTGSGSPGGLMAAASRLLRRGQGDAQSAAPEVFLTAEVGFGGGGSGEDAGDFTASGFASHQATRPEQLKSQVLSWPSHFCADNMP